MNPLTRWWRRWQGVDGNSEPAGSAPGSSPKVMRLPDEPYVFECRNCGKVFDARRRQPACVECDSPDVELMSE